MDKQVFHKCSGVLFHSLDISEICPYLRDYQLITKDEVKKLEDHYTSDVDKINYLIDILSKKENQWLEEFIECLYETSEIIGHRKIIKQLKHVKQGFVKASTENGKNGDPLNLSAVKVTVLESEPYFVEEPIKFVVNCTEAGVSELSIRSSEPPSGERQASFNAHDNKDGAVYVPTAPEVHMFDISWSGKAIKDSPLHMQVYMYGGGAGQVKLVEIPGHILELGTALCLGFDTTEAGKGSIEAKCVGDNSGQISCTIEEYPDKQRRVNICFIPPQADIYHVDVMWSLGGHVPGSPFKINLLPPRAENVELTSRLEEPTTLEAGMPLDLDLDTSIAGGGVLDVTCVGERVGDVPVTATPVGEDKYRITFTPPEIDSYKVSVKWSSEHVKGSRFTINMMQPVANKMQLVSLPATSVESEAPLALEFDTSKAGEGDMKIACNGDKSGEVACKLETDYDDRNRKNISFILPQPDIYNLRSGEHVPGSPFKSNLLPPVAEKVLVVAELEVPLEAGVSADLLTSDTSAARGGELDAICVGSKAGEVPVKVTPSGDDKYNISFTPPVLDIYEVSVKWGGEHVKDSPFKINMLRLAAEKVKLVSPPSATVETGAPLNLGFDTSKAGEGTMNASCIGEKSGNVDCILQQDDSNNSRYNVSFVPPQPDVYHLNITWSGNHIPGPPIAKNAEIVEKIDSAVVESGVPVDLSCDTSAAGGGQLDAICVEETVGEVLVKVEPAGEDKFKILFTPPAPDMYEVSVKWSGEHVKGSPFKIDMLKAEATKVKVVSLPSASLETGNVLVLGFDTTKAGSGHLTVDCKGEESGVVECTITSAGQEQLVSFIPPKEDIYHVNVKWSGSHVPGSPFMLNLLAPTNRKLEVPVTSPVASKLIEPEEVLQQVNESILMAESTYMLEEAPILMFANSHRVDLDIIPEEVIQVVDEDSLEADYIQPMLEADLKPSYIQPLFCKTVSKKVIRLVDENILEAQPPNILEETPIHEFAYGQPVDLDITSSGATLKDVISHAVHVGTQKRVKVTVKELDREQFRLNLKPKHPGIYYVHVFVNKEEIPASPYKIKYCEPFDVKAVKVTLLDSEPYTVGEQVMVMVDCKDAGKGDISIKAVGPALFGVRTKCDITDNTNGTYTAAYIPNSTGNHKLKISESGRPVAGSPVKIRVVQNVAERVKLLKPPSLSLEQGAALSLLFTTSRAGNGKLHASCVGDKSGKVNCKVTTTKDESSTTNVSFVPPQPDIYHVEVKWSGTHVPGSPFKINLLPPVADNVEVVLKPEPVVKSVAPVDLDFDTSAAGSGELVATCQGNRTGEVPVTVTSSGIDKYKISFTPPKPDTYEVSVKWAGVHVKDSPFVINIRPDSIISENVEVIEEELLQAEMEVPDSIISKNVEVNIRRTIASQDGVAHSIISENVEVIEEELQGCPPDLYDMVISNANNVKLVEILGHSLKFDAPFSLAFDTSEAGEGKLEAVCKGDKSGRRPCTVKGNYVSFVPLQEDIYHVDIKWSGCCIPSSPFKINLRSPLPVKNEPGPFKRYKVDERVRVVEEEKMETAIEPDVYFDCSDAVKKIRANYAELANLPINSILGNLYTKKVITMQEKKYIGTLGLETKKMEHLLDNIIIPSLNNKLPVKFEGFLEVMKKSEDSIFTNMAKKLGKNPAEDSPDLPNIIPDVPRGRSLVKPQLTKDKLISEYNDLVAGKMKVKEKSDITDLKDPKYKVLIQTVTNIEFYAAMIQLDGCNVSKYIGFDPICQSTSYYFVGEWGKVPVVIIQVTAKNRNGAHSSWYETLKALHYIPSLRYIFAIGICGGVATKVDLGNVVISQAIYGYNDLNMTPSGWKNNALLQFNTETSVYDCLTHADRIAQQQGIVPGAIMSGSAWLIDDPKLQKVALNHTQEAIIAFEMEGANIFQACSNSKAECLVVKGVYHLIGDFKDDDWQPQAANNAAAYLSKEMNKAIHMFGITTGSLEATPTLKELIHYIDEMAPNYFGIGSELDIKTSKLKSIKKDPNLKGDTQKCYEMLATWLDNDGTSATWRKLCDALNEMSESELAEKIRKTIVSS